MRKTRAVLLGTNAYPFLIRYWYELFTRFWENEVDKVYIAVSKPEHKSVWPYFRKLLHSHPKIEVFETGKMWPMSINEVAREIKEDLIWIPHDDTFVFKRGVLDRYFDIVEKTGKVITPLTQIYSEPAYVNDLLLRKYGGQLPINVPETGEVGFSFYCNMFFVTRELMNKTSMDFGELHVKEGEIFEPLSPSPLEKNVDSDTNFKFELELLFAGAEFIGIPKMEVAGVYNDPSPIASLQSMKENKQGPFSHYAGWVHLQTMAYHIYGLYYDRGEREALEKQLRKKIDRKILNEKAHWDDNSYLWALSMRLAWIKEFMRMSDYDGVYKYRDHAQKEIDWIIKRIGLDKRKINRLSAIFHKMIWG